MGERDLVEHTTYPWMVAAEDDVQRKTSGGRKKECHSLNPRARGEMLQGGLSEQLAYRRVAAMRTDLSNCTECLIRRDQCQSA